MISYIPKNCFLCSNEIQDINSYYDGYQCSFCELNCFIFHNKIVKMSFHLIDLGARVVIDYDKNKTKIMKSKSNLLIKELNEVIYFYAPEDLKKKIQILMLFV